MRRKHDVIAVECWDEKKCGGYSYHQTPKVETPKVGFGFYQHTLPKSALCLITRSSKLCEFDYGRNSDIIYHD